MTEKATGYILLAFGVCIMFVSALFMYLTFSNQLKPFALFTIPSQSTPSLQASDLQGSTNISNVTGLLTSQLGAQLFPPENINKTLNLSTYSILMFFLLSVGFKIASLGVMMIRTINVKLKSSMLELDKRSTPPLSETQLQSQIQTKSQQ